MSADGQGELEPEVPRKNVVGLFCGAAFHDVVFARVSGCDVVRLYDWELRMRKLACLFFPKRGVVKEMDIRAENIGALEADIGLAVPAADAWVHVNAGLPCQDGSKANRRRKPAQLREHVATFFILIQRLQSKYRKVTWFAENVVCPEFVFETILSSSHCDETVAYCDVTVLPPMLEHCCLCLFATAWCFPHLQETTCYSRAVTYSLSWAVLQGNMGLLRCRRLGEETPAEA